MMWTGPQSDPARAKGLFLALLALAVIAAVSPVYVMPGCTMAMEPFDFACSHGIITQHITESPNAAAGIAIAALVAMAVLVLLERTALVGRVVPVVEDPTVDDPLGERLRA